MNRLPIALLLLSLVGVLILSYACQRVTATEYMVDPSSCNGCCECVRACPYNAIHYTQDGKAEIDITKCRACGNCVAVCPNSAIY